MFRGGHAIHIGTLHQRYGSTIRYFPPRFHISNNKNPYSHHDPESAQTISASPAPLPQKPSKVPASSSPSPRIPASHRSSTSFTNQKRRISGVSIGQQILRGGGRGTGVFFQGEACWGSRIRIGGMNMLVGTVRRKAWILTKGSIIISLGIILW